jgi:hypothetical protein
MRQVAYRRYSSQGNQQEILDHQLAKNPPAARPQSDANPDLPLTPGKTNQLKVSQVETSD